MNTFYFIYFICVYLLGFFCLLFILLYTTLVHVVGFKCFTNKPAIVSCSMVQYAVLYFPKMQKITSLGLGGDTNRVSVVGFYLVRNLKQIKLADISAVDLHFVL